jgi:hypothetical protein
VTPSLLRRHFSSLFSVLFSFLLLSNN